MGVVKMILEGMLSISDPTVDACDYRRPDNNGFKRDQESLAGDVKQVGTDMRKAITGYGSKTREYGSEGRLR